MADDQEKAEEQEAPKEQEEQKEEEPKGGSPSNPRKLLLYAGAFVLSFIVIFGVMLIVAYKFLPQEFGLVENAGTDLAVQTEENAEGEDTEEDYVEPLEVVVEEEALEGMLPEIDFTMATAEAVDDPPDELGRMQEQLRQTEEELKERRRELDEQREELEKLRKQVETQVAERTQEEQKRAKRLARIFESMEPEQAAPILENLEDGAIVDILLLAKEREAANILGAIEPGRAAMISNRMRTPE